jgi:glycosyltransferase involved in cell wall biosynthesis
MRIIQLSSYDQQGGAARAALRLHRALLEAGENSTMFVRRAIGNEAGVMQAQVPTTFTGRLDRFLRRKANAWEQYPYRATRPNGLDVFSGIRGETGSSTIDQIPPADVAHMHWVADAFLDLPALFGRLPQRIPLVWTLHDMNGLTGGCHYDDGCRHHETGCGSCPQLGSQSSADLSTRLWRAKARLYSNIETTRLHLVTPSNWLAKEAQCSPLLGRFPISVIANGVDTRIFRPIDQQIARTALNLPKDARVVLFVAESAANRRKGYSLLTQALHALANQQGLVLLTLGADAGLSIQGITCRQLGHLSDDGLLALAYNAANVFALPSLQDNLPNTAVESLACGTPVVGFNVGGIPDLVRPEETGTLVPVADIAAFSAAIFTLLNDDARRQRLSRRCREIALAEFDQKQQAAKYFQLYQTMVYSRIQKGLDAH